MKQGRPLRSTESRASAMGIVVLGSSIALTIRVGHAPLELVYGSVLSRPRD